MSAFNNELIKQALLCFTLQRKELKTGEVSNSPGFMQLFMWFQDLNELSDSEAQAFPILPCDKRGFILPLFSAIAASHHGVMGDVRGRLFYTLWQPVYSTSVLWPPATACSPSVVVAHCGLGNFVRFFLEL